MVSVAIVGIGYWGKNLVRVFSEISEVETCVHTGEESNEKWVARNFPDIEVSTDYSSVLQDPDIDAVVIATPVESHYRLTWRAILAGKDVFVEKPFTDSTETSEELTELAREHDSVVFVGYIFCHHPSVQPLIRSSEDCSIEYGLFAWEKLGAFNRDIFLDLVTHPISLALALFHDDPAKVSTDRTVDVTGGTDIVSARLAFPGDRTFDININRVSQESNKRLQLLFEDGELYHWSEEGVYVFETNDFEYRRIKQTETEPLAVECRQFVSAVEGKTVPATDAEFGHRVHTVIDKMR